MQVMISLVGEQPVPNLLPIRHCKPDCVVLVQSERTRRVGEKVKQLAQEQCQVLCHTISPYAVQDIQHSLAAFVDEHQWSDADLLFNLTGGTKPMAFAAYRLAQIKRAPVVYLESEGGKSWLYRYQFEQDEMTLVERGVIREMLTIDDYLKVHGVVPYKLRASKEQFQELVCETLRPYVSEILSGVSRDVLDIDLTIRCRNQVGVAEVKSGKAAERKDGIDQLSTASQREFLGTYTKRFLILDRQLGTNNRELAHAHNIIVIELVGEHTQALSPENHEHLVSTVLKELGGMG